MKAIGYTQAGPIGAADSLVEIEAETPELRPHDLLVEVRGISVNPVDVKVRENQQPDSGTKIIAYRTDGHFPAIIELIKPRGHVAFIDDPETLDIKSGKSKALSFSWEFMFARSMFQTNDIEK